MWCAGVNPGDWLAVYVRASDGKARLVKREDDGALTIVATSTTVLSLTSTTWYNAKVLVDDDTGTPALQRLRFWVDTDGDSTFSDETTLLDSTVVDDDWSAGYVGLYRHNDGSAFQQFDDVLVKMDANGDSTMNETQISDDFNSNTATLSYDNNGNLADDGILVFVYDAWNRLRKAQRKVGATVTTVGDYSYLGDNRRCKKVVTYNAAEVYPNDGGNTTVVFTYGSVSPPSLRGSVASSLPPWNIFETRNGSGQTTWQYVWGTQYVDEILLADKQGDGSGNDVDPDTTAGGETADLDHRYFYHQDRNRNVVALTDYGAGIHGAIVEQYYHIAIGRPTISDGGTLGTRLFSPPTGNLYTSFGWYLQREVGIVTTFWADLSATAGTLLENQVGDRILSSGEAPQASHRAFTMLTRPSILNYLASPHDPPSFPVGRAKACGKPDENGVCPLGCYGCGHVPCFCLIGTTCCVYGGSASCCGIFSPFCCKKFGNDPDCCNLIEIIARLIGGGKP